MFLLESAFLQKLIEWDKWLFIKINNGLANPIFDAVMPYLREPSIWTPAYIFLLIFAITNFKTKGLWWCLFFICLVAMTDLVSAKVMKENIERVRPCYDTDLYGYIRLLVKNCGGKHSFTSNHAANHFGMSVFMFLTFRPVFRKWAWLILIWGVLIGFAQVYVGLHFPGDVLGGALIGIFFGSLVAWFFHKKFGFITFDQQPTS
jgi:membrane-associated phospholipid phosphatase